MSPVGLFQINSRVDVREQHQYATGIHVMLTTTFEINGPMMELYVRKFFEKVNQLEKLRSLTFFSSGLR